MKDSQQETASSSQLKDNNNQNEELAKLTYQNMSYYSGEVIAGTTIREGSGSIYNSGGQLIYTGNWKQDEYSGIGKLFNVNCCVGGKLSGDAYKNFSKVGKQWVSYEGGFVRGKKEGVGVWKFVGGEFFQGVFEEDRVNGKGVFQGCLGKRVVGEWSNNKIVTVVNKKEVER